MSNRPLLLATSVRNLLSPILRECPPQCGIVTITDVLVTSDLSYVTLCISALNDPAAAIEFLQSRQKELQRKLGGLGTHKTPHLRFRIDTQSQKASRIDQLLEDASRTTPLDDATAGH